MPDNREIRDFLTRLLNLRADRRPFDDDSSLFLSGRLGSVDAVELVVLLEERYALDFTETGFDLAQIDSLNAIHSLLASAQTPLNRGVKQRE